MVAGTLPSSELAMLMWKTKSGQRNRKNAGKKKLCKEETKRHIEFNEKEKEHKKWLVEARRSVEACSDLSTTMMRA